MARIAELSNTKRENNAAFYTNKFYDIRKTGNGRLIDQKCTKDVRRIEKI